MGASLWADYCGGFFFLNITKADKNTITRRPKLQYALSDWLRDAGRVATYFLLAFQSHAT
jgi:hypothetical protein